MTIPRITQQRRVVEAEDTYAAIEISHQISMTSPSTRTDSDATCVLIFPSHNFTGFDSAPIEMKLDWSVREPLDDQPIIVGRTDYWPFVTRLFEVQKHEGQHRERLAALALDEHAKKLLDVLDQETSIKWDELQEVVDGEWSDVARSVAILAAAHLCETSPTRMRLSEYGDNWLAEASSWSGPVHDQIDS